VRVALAQIGEPRLHSIATPVAQRLDAFVSHRGMLLRRRVAERRAVDGRGDLRPEHVCLQGMAIIDCLDFAAICGDSTPSARSPFSRSNAIAWADHRSRIG